MSGEATSGRQVADEADRVFNDVVETTYSHENYIDVATGTYNVDCNGFVGFVSSRRPRNITPRSRRNPDISDPEPSSIKGTSPTCPTAEPAAGSQSLTSPTPAAETSSPGV